APPSMTPPRPIEPSSRRSSDASASVTSDSPPTARGCPRSRRASPGPRTLQDDPHELPRSPDAPRPPPGPRRDRVLPVGPAPAQQVRGPLHEPGPAGQPDASPTSVAPPPPAGPLSRRDRRAAHRPGAPDDGD